MNENKVKTDKIKDFWNTNPCGSNFVDCDGSVESFIKYDEFRYTTESHILEEFDKIDFSDKLTLEIRLGQGSDSMQIVNRGAKYYGIDLTETSVNKVIQRFKVFNRAYVDIIKADATKIPCPDEFFDIVYSHGVIHHSPHIEKIVSEIHRVLKKMV